MIKIKFLKNMTPNKSEYIIEVNDSSIGMKGFLVIDSTVLGPGKGGIRMTQNVTLEEVRRLAETMTWKNSLADIPFGGAKAGIVWPGGSDELKKEFVQSFGRAIKPFIPRKYIAGPDVGTGEKEMQWLVEATGIFRSATGKPADLCVEIRNCKRCGIPHEFGSTGFGVAQATKVAADIAGIDLKGAKVSIHGFGNVGTFTYRFLSEMGAKIVAIADKNGVIYSEDGLEREELDKIIKERRDVCSYNRKVKKMMLEDFWNIPVDILIPASVTDVINEGNKDKVKAKIIVEAANIPMPEKIENEFFKKGVLIVPDFVANAGGVISSYSEHRGHSIEKMFATVESKLKKTVRQVLKESVKKGQNPRQTALALAARKIEKKLSTRKRTF